MICLKIRKSHHIVYFTYQLPISGRGWDMHSFPPLFEYSPSWYTNVVIVLGVLHLY